MKRLSDGCAGVDPSLSIGLAFNPKRDVTYKAWAQWSQSGVPTLLEVGRPTGARSARGGTLFSHANLTCERAEEQLSPFRMRS